MKISKEKRLEIVEKKEILNNTKIELRKEFVGLDDVIDELIDGIQSWYLFPEGQIRPIVLNLWGLTGVGKTSLIQALFKHLKMDDVLYKFNVGDYSGQDENRLAHLFSNELKNKEKMPVGIMFDEFQLGRTINENGGEIQKSGLRAIWDILDSGKLEHLDYNWSGSRLVKLIFLLEKCIVEDVEIKNGVVTKKLSKFNEIFDITPPSSNGSSSGKEVYTPSDKNDTNIYPDNFIIPLDYTYSIKSCFYEEFYSENTILNHFNRFNNIKELVDYLNVKLKELFKPRLFDYTKSCIFIIGNLDEAYGMTKEVSPDNNADDFHKHSLSITLTHIKASLKKRFRVEQIGRLGNNHIIYKAFSSQTYRDLINLELGRIKKHIENDFELEIVFDETINDIIYKEGVFPTLGTRPVFTTINTMIESTLSKITLDIADSNKNINKINWSFKYDDKAYHIIKFLEDDKVKFEKEYQIKLKLENRRKSNGSEQQLLNAVHESGHAVASIMIMNMIPNVIVSKTSNAQDGFCSSEYPELKLKSWYEEDICVSLSGIIAEKLIFGDDFISNGSASDITRATGNALLAGQQYGMLSEQMSIGIIEPNTQYQVYKDTSPTDIEARNWINSCYKKSEKVLADNMELLLELSKYLTYNSKIEKEGIIQILEDLEYPVDEKSIEEYYNLHDRFQAKYTGKVLEKNMS